MRQAANNLGKDSKFLGWQRASLEELLPYTPGLVQLEPLLPALCGACVHECVYVSACARAHACVLAHEKLAVTLLFQGS